jgi:hypothetical protein
LSLLIQIGTPIESLGVLKNSFLNVPFYLFVFS